MDERTPAGMTPAARPPLIVNEDDKITLADGKVLATVLRIYTRESCQRTGRDIASTSGGSAWTVNRQAFEIFQQFPHITRILYVSTRAPLVMFLMEIKSQWFDIKGEPAKIRRT